MSDTLMFFVLNCLDKLAPWKAAPRTAASSALTFKAILSLKLKMLTGEMEFKEGTYSPTAALTAACTIGTRVVPPVRITEVMLSRVNPAFFNASPIGCVN